MNHRQTVVVVKTIKRGLLGKKYEIVLEIVACSRIELINREYNRIIIRNLIVLKNIRKFLNVINIDNYCLVLLRSVAFIITDGR